MKKLTLGLLLLAAVSASAASLNDLYFGLDNMRGFAEVYWWFLADGRVLQGLPTTGVTPQDFDGACKASPGFCGTYTLNGSKLSIHYGNGQTQDWTYAAMNGGIQLNYLILTPVGKYPAGAKLNGAWSRASSSTVVSSSTSAVQITSPTFLTFQQDGTFAEKNITGIDTVSSVKGANGSSSQTSQSGGTYTINGNALMLVRNGKSERHMIFPAPGDNLNIDGRVYSKQK
jgi:hypothetical protein